MPGFRAVLAGAPRTTALDGALREGTPAHRDRIGELRGEAGTNRGGGCRRMFHVLKYYSSIHCNINTTFPAACPFPHFTDVRPSYPLALTEASGCA